MVQKAVRGTLVNYTRNFTEKKVAPELSSRGDKMGGFSHASQLGGREQPPMTSLTSHIGVLALNCGQRGFQNGGEG